jgi:hypothetical protein
VHGSRLGGTFCLPPGISWSRYLAEALEGSMLDLLFIGLTIVAFGVLWLLVKGVERFER